ncbi:MAG TPA: thioredoxin domain-containing protein [Candidatus Angelobacter sp.]|nr:thioredoxin domain-containing protein [Candidatus Angelobacter sp.]
MVLRPRPIAAFLLLALAANVPFASPQADAQSQSSTPSTAQAPKSAVPKAAQSKPPSPEEELQLALSDAGNDRASLVRNLEEYLKKYPQSQQRPQIYRALVEACLQLRDTARAADYAERIVSLSPDDISITVLAIQLLEQQGDEAGLRRAVNYSGRVLNLVERKSASEKSPRISQAEWTLEQKRDRMSLLALRGRLEQKLKDTSAAQKDFEASYAVMPSAGAAEQLGEIAELNKDLSAAARQYARAFALSESINGAAGRGDIRKKLGNVWRLAHGSESGLGEYLLQAFDEVAKSGGEVRVKRNADAREPSDFVLRKAPEGTPYPLKDAKGKVIAVNFWATWCGPCHALEPLFAHVAAEYQGLPTTLFLSANCDEDETLVAPYLRDDKPRTEVVFADGLDRLFSIDSFPTVVVIDREGKIAFRSNGFNPDTFERDLSAAIKRTLAAPLAK